MVRRYVECVYKKKKRITLQVTQCRAAGYQSESHRNSYFRSIVRIDSIRLSGVYIFLHRHVAVLWHCLVVLLAAGCWMLCFACARRWHDVVIFARVSRTAFALQLHTTTFAFSCNTRAPSLPPPPTPGSLINRTRLARTHSARVRIPTNCRARPAARQTNTHTPTHRLT